MSGLELSTPRRLHVVGVGGAGMSAIALVLAQMGHRVSGSDLHHARAFDRLAVAGVTVFVGHDAAQVTDDLDAVIVSTAVRPTNAEVVAARQRSVPVVARAAALAAIVGTKRAIAVAGSHGKTTTSSMLTLVLRAAGLQPSFLVGGELNEVGTNAAWDEGEWVVVEADESDGTFLALPAEIGVVTSVEADHLDHYGDVGALDAAFGRFADQLAGRVVVCADDPGAARLASGRGPAVTYGFGSGADYRIEGYVGERAGSRFSLRGPGGPLGQVALPVPGRHNASNAAAAAAVASELGVDPDPIRTALAGFGGVARRFQFRGEVDGVTLVDDYAHLPAEVAAAVAAALEGGWGRVVVVFQPHRYTRTAALGAEFASAFRGADAVVVTDVYAAGEDPLPGVSGRIVADAVRAECSEMTVEYRPARADLRDVPRRLAGPGDVVLTLGAGDLTTLPDEWTGTSS